MIQHCTADDEGVAEMHRWHCGEGIDVIPFHPNTLTVVVANCVEETIFSRKETRWHAGVADEDNEGEEVR